MMRLNDIRQKRLKRSKQNQTWQKGQLIQERTLKGIS